MTIHALLIDDDPLLLSGLTRALRAESFLTEAVTDPYRAMDLVESNSFDVVICDEKMPGISGCQVLHTIALARPRVVRVMLTGSTASSVATRAVNEGYVDRLFFKPISTEILVDGIRSALQQRLLLDSANRLLRIARDQQACLDRIERSNPGITRIDRDSSGAIVLDTASLESLAEEIERATARSHSSRWAPSKARDDDRS